MIRENGPLTPGDYRNDLQLGGSRGSIRIPIQMDVADISENASTTTDEVPADLQMGSVISCVGSKLQAIWCGDMSPDVLARRKQPGGISEAS